MNLLEERQLVLVDKKVLPEVFDKVLLAKSYLSKNLAKNSSEACKMADLSRSAFYKYKDSVFFYEDQDKSRVITYSLWLSDDPGVLSEVLTALSRFGVNVLTVNQNIPVDRVALVTISFRMKEDTFGELAFVVHKRRRHHAFNLFSFRNTLCFADQLDNAAPIFRIGDILKRNLCNSLSMDLFGIDLPPECQRSQNTNFAAGVMPLYIRSRISLRIAKILRHFQRGIKGDSLFNHLGQDKIRRTI